MSVEQRVNFPTSRSPEILVAVPNDYPQHHYEVALEVPDFSFICKKTLIPDHCSLKVIYLPKDHLIETTHMRQYFWSYRNHLSFFEDCCNLIADDLFNLIQPQWLEVHGYMMILGGTAIAPKVILGNRGV